MSSDVAYYNEFDPYVAQWLRNLITAGHIAPGIVDERSIEDVTPNDLIGFTQCHFFAGIGVWSLALRCAGWPDSRPIWTGSYPCQPFSTAGEGAGFADERHLWPAFHHLIAECRPSDVIGEQVAGGPVGPWIDLVHADMEGLGYAFGCVPFPSAGVGAPHIRDRLYWVADANARQWGRQSDNELLAYRSATGWQQSHGQFEPDIDLVRLGDPSRTGLGQRFCNPGIPGEPIGARERQTLVGASFHPSGVANLPSQRRNGGQDSARPPNRPGVETSCFDGDGTGPTNGYWRDADWLSCTDGKWRPVEPGTFPLVAGAGLGVGRVRADPNTPCKDQGSRTGRLKGYGNAINKEAAVAFIRSIM